MCQWLIFSNVQWSQEEWLKNFPEPTNCAYTRALNVMEAVVTLGFVEILQVSGFLGDMLR